MERRNFLITTGGTLCVLLPPALLTAGARQMVQAAIMGNSQRESEAGGVLIETARPKEVAGHSNLVTLFLCGDVMTGRGIDQILPHPSDPPIHEPYVRSALGYVKLAEEVSGPIPRPVDCPYIWGDALEEFAYFAPDLKIINLETAVTTSDDWQAKGINYRMHPDNVPCISAGKIDCCVLANNHVLDWGRAGLRETLRTLRSADLAYAGAGRDQAEARAPAILHVPGRGRVLVFSFGSETSGIPRSWAAERDGSGVNLLPDLSDATVARIAAQIHAIRQPGDLVVASIHWGGNWGYEISRSQIRFAHGLIDEADVHVVHGHSSHHPKGIEVYRDRPIIYGCGDFLNDYEGIGGYEGFRADLALMYFPVLAASTGKLVRFQMSATRIRRFRVTHANADEAHWLADVLTREGKRFDTGARMDGEHRLILEWGSGQIRF